MAIYDGVVSLSDNKVPVIIELGDDTVRLSADGTEVGEWPITECDITREDDTTYLIHAEAETLPFTPAQPGAFAVAIGLTNEKAAVPLPPEPVPAQIIGHAEAPPPQPLTMGLFYALCVLTLALATWAVISIAL